MTAALPALLIAVTFASFDQSRLAGTLTFPARAARPVPAVVLLGANGPEDRDERVGATAVFAQYASALNAAGFAVLRYDNRGIGESTSATQAQSVRRQNFIDDASAAIRAAASDPSIDAHRVYVLGLSEGAETALGAALAGAPVRGLVLVGPLSIPYAQALEESIAGAPPEVKARVTLLERLPYFASYDAVDPRREIALVTQPLFAVRGARDTQTPESDFVQLIGAAKDSKRAIDVARFAGDDHFLLQLSATEESGGPNYGAEHALDPAALAAIAAWLRAH